MLGTGQDLSVNLVPTQDSCAWVSERLASVVERLGPEAQLPRTLTQSEAQTPGDLDGLFDMICGIQAEIGQDDVEFTLLEMHDGEPGLPPGFVPVGEPQGHLLHTFHRRGEYILLMAPAIFRVAPLVLGGIGRELGRISLHQRGPLKKKQEAHEAEADAELAGVALGMGVWVANGAYVFENACCGGGCGIDLGGLRSALSMPEVCFALALDARRKGLGRRSVGRHLDSTQRAAYKHGWTACKRAPQLALPAASA